MTGLSTDPGELQIGARTMVAGGSPGAGLPAAVGRALRAVASGAGDAQLAEAACRTADLWGGELAELDTRSSRFAIGLHAAGETYAAGEGSVVASVRRP